MYDPAVGGHPGMSILHEYLQAVGTADLHRGSSRVANDVSSGTCTKLSLVAEYPACSVASTISS